MDRHNQKSSLKSQIEQRRLRQTQLHQEQKATALKEHERGNSAKNSIFGRKQESRNFERSRRITTRKF